MGTGQAPSESYGMKQDDKEELPQRLLGDLPRRADAPAGDGTLRDSSTADLPRPPTRRIGRTELPATRILSGEHPGQRTRLVTGGEAAAVRREGSRAREVRTTRWPG
ncbi:hypothetical protein GCM10010140_13940 [Streptosporangium pseudovulgare]|uniref:Uncharacterized protein n=1 Tax=Streptosporangium pseudovulgare TaxID=35765 RepID=A0ABQ2QMD6_9ACTN|nr:hypothetical protein GCM10010140_13940 [Streptosporangium pseudovulgare]